MVLLPFVGLLAVRSARKRSADPRVQAELTGAVRCQTAGAAVWLLHIGVQLAIAGVGWLVDAGSTHNPGLQQAAGWILGISTVLNVVMWVAEWAVFVVAGLRAAAGHPYPLVESAQELPAAASWTRNSS